jgi:deoxyhypusine synthase
LRVCLNVIGNENGDFVFFILHHLDISLINYLVLHAPKTGIIICGGGVIKHHICNANLMRNGADYAVYINTGVEQDCSDAGASPEEAKSWGKIKTHANAVKVCNDVC